MERCVTLLEHVVRCPSYKSCDQGGACLRAKQVLSHHRSCSREHHCQICLQLKDLCYMHSRRCQEKERNCNVPYCLNRSKFYSVNPGNQVGSSRESFQALKRVYMLAHLQQSLAEKESCRQFIYKNSEPKIKTSSNLIWKAKLLAVPMK